MFAIRDVLILSTVYMLACLYTLLVYPWLPVSAGSGPIPRAERLAMAAVLGALLLAVANNYVSALVGSRAAGIVLLLVPVVNLIAIAVRPARRSRFLADVTPGWWRDAGAVLVSGVFILLALPRLFFWKHFSEIGVLYPDLLWHVGRVAEQAFQSSPGFWPLSPMAFPARLPFEAFAGDSLVSATFRYVPIEVHAFNYSQVLFAWAMVLWTAVVLMAGSGPIRALIVLSTAMLLIPVAVWGLNLIGYIMFVFFHANPNTLIAFPVALAFTFHLSRSWHRRAPPVPLFLVAVPAVIFFVKPNQSFALGFLQLTGFAAWLASGERSGILKAAAWAAAAWAAAILLTRTAGPWPVSPGIVPSSENLWTYARVAIPALGGVKSVPRLLDTGLTYVLMVGGICSMATLLRLSMTPSERHAVGTIAFRDVAMPLIVLGSAMAYLLIGWWAIAPTGLAEGEPMHVNFEMIVWLMIVAIATAFLSLYDAGARADAPLGRRLVAGSLAAASLALTAQMIYRFNYEPLQQGGLALDETYNLALEGTLRKALAARIPGGHCFAYNRRYALYVNKPYDPDFAIAATGCPVINGNRWRGYLGKNNIEEIRNREPLLEITGAPFHVIETP